MVLKESDLAVLERGDPAPKFELPGVDGGTHSLEDFREYEALLLVFTCNHCPYAKAKFEALNSIAEDYSEVAVVGVNPNDTEDYPEDSFEMMEALVEEGTIRYDHYLRDETQEVARRYGAVCTPDPYLFRNDDGEFRLAYHGRLDDAMDPEEEPSEEPGFEMRGAIETVLDGDEVPGDWPPSQGCSIKWRDD